MADPNFKQGQNIELTCGDFADEKAACEAFDEAIKTTGLFTVYKEVSGFYLQPQIGKDPKERARIDRILFPTQNLCDAGWPIGAIGVEIKKSDTKVGPPLSQSLDYLRVAWFGPKQIKVMIDYCFLFPMEKIGNAVASIMSQNRIGSVCLQYPPDSEYHRLAFFSGEQSVLSYFYNTGEIKLGCFYGKRMGSR